MSNPIDTINGTADIAAEAKMWELRCAELSEERDRLRAELTQTRAQRDQYLKSLYYMLRKSYAPPNFTREEVFAHLDDKPTFEEIVAELERGLEKPA
jgi:hypothetical protein